ncbi:glycosyltransferase family 47 protein [Flavobacterium sp. CHNK8]|uniref:exostosin domain-containing protein n=1 Tax=Flavobacterium sp. CHNK8 TaxID=2871165 RepID=UPI001C8ED8B4|nr:exostosin family protein [Flavobacterium sp. CHNK8]QZK89641.1 glycosyltransferase family 47 protein [Flavobacterium sp. CHNK8]
MLKIYTNHLFITPENRKEVFPLLFDLCYTENSILHTLYEFVSTLEACDVAIVPVNLRRFGTRNDLNQFISEAQKRRKIVWLYSGGDFGLTLDSAVQVFRNGGFHSKLPRATFILPSFINDPFQNKDQVVAAIPKTALPQIGFVGHAANSITKQLKELIGYCKNNLDIILKREQADFQKFYPSSTKRYHFLKQLSKSEKVGTNFILRKNYSAGAKTVQDKAIARKEFFYNIAANPYTFCMRGAGNFSVRFYETLAMGRIPVVVNTDIRLPLVDQIDWSKHCVMVSEENMIQELVAFHKAISPEGFIQMQIANRNLWLNFLEREAYFRTIYRVFKNRINEV